MWGETEAVGVDKKSLQQMQEEETLKGVRDKAHQPSQPFFKEDEVLYRKWEPQESGTDNSAGNLD